MTELKKYCIIRFNKDIRDLLLKQIIEASLTLEDVARYAKKKGKKFSASQLSRYFKESKFPDRRIPTQEDILWLCNEFDIDVNIYVELRKLKTKNKRFSNRLKQHQEKFNDQ